MSDTIKNYLLWGIVTGAGILVVLTVWAAGKLILGPTAVQNSAIVLPIIILVGVVVLVMVLGLLTFVFSSLKLQNENEALGLPSGSVRAVIALMLLVIFAIVSIYLYSSVAGGKLLSLEGVTKEQLVDVRKQMAVVLTMPTDGAGPFKVYVRDSSAAGDDLAKQLIVLLGTLVTAVSSFYFGASAVAAAKKEDLPPTRSASAVKAVNVSALKQQDEPQDLIITGENLSGIKTVRLVQGNDTVGAETKSVKPTEVSCKVKIDSTKPKGKWDVFVNDGQNDMKLDVPAIVA